LRNAQGRVTFGHTADASAAITFQEVAGRYSVLAGSPRGRFAVTRISSAAGAINGNVVDIQAGGPTDLTAFLTAGVVNVEGIVKRGDKPASGVMVALVPKSLEAQPELFRRDQSDLDGSFVLRGVIPGQYAIVAIEDAWSSPWLERDFLTRYLLKGQSINVTEN